MSKTSQLTNRAIIKQGWTSDFQERERENYKIILMNKGKQQNNDISLSTYKTRSHLTRSEAKRWCIIDT